MIAKIAVISSKFISNQGLPKAITIKQLQDNRCYVLVTGDGHNPQTGGFTDSPSTTDDNGFTVNENAVFNGQGNVMMLVSPDGSHYTVIGDSFARIFSAVDSDNQR